MDGECVTVSLVSLPHIFDDDQDYGGHTDEDFCSSSLVLGAGISPGCALLAGSVPVRVEPTSPRLTMSLCADDSVERGISFCAGSDSPRGAPQACQDVAAFERKCEQPLCHTANVHVSNSMDEAKLEGGDSQQKSARIHAEASKRKSPTTPKHSGKAGRKQSVSPSPNSKSIRGSPNISPSPTSRTSSSATRLADRPTTPTPHRRAPYQRGAAQATQSRDAADSASAGLRPKTPESCAAATIPPRVTVQHVRCSPTLVPSGDEHESTACGKAELAQTRAVAGTTPQEQRRDGKAMSHHFGRPKWCSPSGTPHRADFSPDASAASTMQGAPRELVAAADKVHDSSDQQQLHEQCVKPFARVAPGPGLNNKTDLMSSIRLARKGTGVPSE
jgi:hypothetical protein